MLIAFLWLNGVIAKEIWHRRHPISTARPKTLPSGAAPRSSGVDGGVINNDVFNPALSDNDEQSTDKRTSETNTISNGCKNFSLLKKKKNYRNILHFTRSDDCGSSICPLSMQHWSITTYKTSVYKFTNGSYKPGDSSNTNVQSDHDHNGNIFCLSFADLDFSPVQIV